MAGFKINPVKVEPDAPRFEPFPVLEAGSYDVRILDAKIVDFTKNAQSKYLGESALALELAVEGTKRKLYPRIGLFTKYKPTEKNPGGAKNFTFFQFVGAIKGQSQAQAEKEFNEAVEAGKDYHLPPVSEISGKTIRVKVDVVEDAYQYNKAKAEAESQGAAFAWSDGVPLTPADFLRNEVNGYYPADGNAPASASASALPNVAVTELKFG